MADEQPAQQSSSATALAKQGVQKISGFASSLTGKLWGSSSAPATPVKTPSPSASTTSVDSNNNTNNGNNQNGTEGVIEGETETVDENSISTTMVPESEKSSFLAFIKRAMGGIDLSKIAAPPFILSTFSMLEANSDLMAHPDIFSQIAQQDTPQKRMVWYTKWYLSRFHKQSTTGSGKKPYNPILGERFLCSWEDRTFGKVTLTSEQVSHHPPILGEYYENTDVGIVNMSHFGLKSAFSGTVVKARVEASNWTRLIKLEEDYVCTSPMFLIRGFMVAQPFFDAVGEAILHCPTTGYKTILEFKDKPWFRGEYHQMLGRIFHEDSPDDVLYTISGNWKKVVHITETRTGNKEVLFDTSVEMYDRFVPPVDQQDDMESQKVWRDVTEALRDYNYSTAGTAKNKIEERQRELARTRAETGEEFSHKYFYYDQESERWLLKDYETRFEHLRSLITK